MTEEILIEVENLKVELQSFPVTQSLFLLFSKDIEIAQLKKCAILFKVDSEKLLGLSEVYSYNLGYIKETFDNVSLEFEVVRRSTTGVTYKCTPTTALRPDSKYRLFIDSALSTPFINVTKTVTKGSSSVEVSYKKQIKNAPATYIVKVLSNPKITDLNNIVKLGITYLNTYAEHILDLKRTNILPLEYFDLKLIGDIFACDEQFTIVINTPSRMSEDYLLEFKTALSESIKHISPALASSEISNLDILNYYTSVNNTTNRVVESEIIYLNEHTFKVYLNGVNKQDIVISDIELDFSEAFNNYLLNSMELYIKDLKYRVIVTWDDFDESILFNVEPFIDNTTTQKLVIDTSNW